MKVPAYIALNLSALALAAILASDVKAQSAGAGPLDGFRYSAWIVCDDGSRAASEPLVDTLLFERGEFSSAICVRYNFKPSEYWVRQDGEAIEFLAELNSPTDGRMIWRGTVRNGELEGTMRWIRKRWYRTLDVTHTIHGTVEAAPGR
jgi:hypothetical protein